MQHGQPPDFLSAPDADVYTYSSSTESITGLLYMTSRELAELAVHT